ncbi:hypothetical protein ACFLZ2_01895 [Candidatus Margulisiibacteriota bacterium]
MTNFTIARAVNQAAFKVGLWAYRRPATRRAFNAAADAVSRSMRSLLGEEFKDLYNEGSVRSEIVQAIAKEPDLKKAVLDRTSQYDLERFRETGYVRSEIWRIISKGPDYNIKTLILSRMPLRECYQRFYDWNKTNGAKWAIPCRRGWTHELMNLFGADYGPYEGKYKGIFYSDVILRVQLKVSVLNQLPPRHKATEKNLKDVRSVVEDFELNLVLGSRSLDEWYGEFYRYPSKYCAGSSFFSPMLAIADDLMSKAEGNVGEETDTVGILTRMIPKVVLQKLAHLSEDEAKEELFEPLNEYLSFLQWLPVPGTVGSEGMVNIFRWALHPKRGWLFGQEETSDMGITMAEYAQAGMEKLYGVPVPAALR